MYYVLSCNDRVRLPAQFFSMKLEEALTQILREKYERRVNKDTGVSLAVWNVKPEGDGLVIPGDNAAYYDVKFDTLTYLPQINEIIESEVSEVVEFGGFVTLGPIEALVHLSQIANDFLTYNKKTQTFVGRESKKFLKKGDHVFAKISTVSMKNNIPETKIGLTMRPDGLGKDEWISAKKAAAAEPGTAPKGHAEPKKESEPKKEAKKKKKE
ncbi:MAG: DNA-directed RNA polymerase [Candidatus Micrarchaeota archaeon]|nr:DNA-directed RNA polymerase [Candidatus Micrarchaeota archaeon]